jgi:hypothetical protein
MSAPAREPVPDRSDVQIAVGPADQVQGRAGLAADLVQGAEDVRVVQLDGPDPGQPAEDPGQLGAVHPAQLGDPQRQLPVAVPAGAVDERVMRAQAGPQHDLLAAELHRRKHVGAVVRPVPGDLVQLPLAQHRRVDVLVPGLALGVADVLLQGVPDGRAVGQPVRQARADQRIGVEQAQLAAELAVVVHGGLLTGMRRVTAQKAPGALAPGLFDFRHQSARRDTLRRRRQASALHGVNATRARGTVPGPIRRR